MHAPLPLPELEALLRRLTSTAHFGEKVEAIIINILDGERERCIALHCRAASGSAEWRDSSANGVGVAAWPQKASRCQYVVAAKDVVCMQHSEPRMDILSHLRQISQVEPATHADSALAAAMAPDGEVGRLRSPSFLAAHPGLARVLQLFRTAGARYVGAPIYCPSGRRVLGALCSIYSGMDEGGGAAAMDAELAAQRVLQLQTALQVSSAIEAAIRRAERAAQAKRDAEAAAHDSTDVAARAVTAGGRASADAPVYTEGSCFPTAEPIVHTPAAPPSITLAAGGRSMSGRV